MSIKEFAKEDLVELVYASNEDIINNMKFITIVDICSSRWESHHELIFMDMYDFRYYKADYSKGLTEQQDVYPFQDEDDMIECYEVTPVNKTVTNYVLVEDKRK